MRSHGQLLVRSGIILAAVAAPASVHAQTDTARVSISGTVIDPLHNPVEGAEVRVVGANLSGLTSAQGTFCLSAPRAKVILVQVRRPGYNAQILKIDGEWNGTVLLEPGKFELPEIQVTARYAKPARYAGTTKYDEYFRRRRLGLGEFISREEIEARAPSHTPEILQGRAGIRVDLRHADEPGGVGGSMISFSRCNEYPPKINVYVDGHRLIPRNAPGLNGGESPLGFIARHPTSKELEERRETRMIVGEMLERINPSDIELIEIYRGPGEVPAEFYDGNCGAIAIWTRSGRS